MLNFCTLFNSYYLSRGLALYRSLEEHCSRFHLYIYAFDDLSFEILHSLNLKHATIISLTELEDSTLLSVKPLRSVGEYCWTCTPSAIKHAIDTYNLDACTYLDADLYFFSDPSVLIEEIGNKSVLITEHRYTPEYDQSATSGIFCVQFMTFKNDIYGINVLNWWREACIDWCYARFEDGKFGDQKYLDDWPTRFKKVHVLENLGGGVAPWNVQQYDLANGDINVIFYHFHALKFLKKNRVDLGGYRISIQVLCDIYNPYLSHLESIENELESRFNFYTRDITISSTNSSFMSPLRAIKRQLKGEYNLFNMESLLCLK